MNSVTEQHRQTIRAHYLADENQLIPSLIQNSQLEPADRTNISHNAAELITQVRSTSKLSMMEKFLAEYGLTTQEGIALMCLAEALLRVPDTLTIDALIEDKVVGGNWKDHLGQSASSLVNGSTWALLITGKLLKEDERKTLGTTLKGMLKRLGEPVVRKAVAQAMKELGSQFVLGRTIEEASNNGQAYEKQGYTYSYDMLGEAARTDADARRYHKAYSDAIAALAPRCTSDDIRNNPGISVKLSALHARYEEGQSERVMHELVERTLALALQAKDANMGFNIDAEEADRLDLSLDVIEAVLADSRLEGWSGFGVVVQAFGLRASFVLDWLHATATALDRQIMVRLVKGAYWDAEIKRAQVMGLDGFPVFSRKVNTDTSYMCCAEKLLAMSDRIYPQFATHNAHSVATILYMAQQKGVENFEFQRLHGMGESLHDAVIKHNKTRCRIYAPVGAHQDLLAYLVRRLLENGANSSFVNQIVDTRIAPESIAKDPFSVIEAQREAGLTNDKIAQPKDMFGNQRTNAKGWDITDRTTLAELEAARNAFHTTQWQAKPMIAGDVVSSEAVPIFNPANPDDRVGSVVACHADDIETAISAAVAGQEAWSNTPVSERAACLLRVADAFEQHAAELFSLASREAGKTLLDCVGEIREAVDFARYYAQQAETLAASEARGVVSCISPWNFPLAIFSGQVLAALAAGNSVLAKPADQTPLIAARAVELMHQAGIPKSALQLLPGSGIQVGAPITSDPRIAAVCFTGSTLTAQRINRAMADNMSPTAPLVAETGGMNAMIVDSTALPEQVVRDVVMSAFQSAGQRCSALRVLYVQEDIAEHLLEMLYGAMDELRMGNPWLLKTDVGPVIDAPAQAKIMNHIERFAAAGKMLKQVAAPLDIAAHATFVPPTVLSVSGIAELEEEIFGPVLHVATFAAKDIDQVVNDINAKGFGLTFGLHTRMDSRVEHIVNQVRVGNIYVNRNQIGAVVGSQPFGGEGLSGTGPKAGGPHYVPRFTSSNTVLVDANSTAEDSSSAHVSADELAAFMVAADNSAWSQFSPEIRNQKLATVFADGFDIKVADLPAALSVGNTETMPGPTGEMNALSNHARGVVLCLGPDLASALEQVKLALQQGSAAVVIAPETEKLIEWCQQADLPVLGKSGRLDTTALSQVNGFACVCSQADEAELRTIRQALASRDGALLPLITELDQPERLVIERHLCIDTTAAGGNASLIASAE